MNYVTALVQLPLVRELNKESIRSPEDVVRVCADISNLAQETFHVLMLNTKSYLINRQMITIGLVDASLVHPREVFRQAIVENATAILLVHNHPSGDPTPSAEDIKITKQLIKTGIILNIMVQDHVIIGDQSYSMKEHGIVEF